MHGCCFCRCWLLFFFSLKDNIISVTFGTFSCFLSRSTQSFWLIHSLLSLQKTKKIVVDQYQYQNQYFETHKYLHPPSLYGITLILDCLKYPKCISMKKRLHLVSLGHGMKSKSLQSRAAYSSLTGSLPPPLPKWPFLISVRP